ncbi:MAG: lipopolysaccharide biosynthesis protein [Saprospiraceae bacterium]
MGIIKKQAIGFSIVNYLGVGIGSISTIFLYPRDEKAYGLFRFLLDSANLIQPFAMLGAWYIGVRMFSVFKNEKNGNNGLWLLLTLMFALGSIIFAFSFSYLQPLIFPVEHMKDSTIFARYIWTIIPLFILFGYFVLARQYASNFLKVIVPSFLDQLIKISFPIIFILYLSKLIDLDGLVIGVLLHFALMVILSLGYLSKIKALSWTIPRRNFLTKNQWRSLAGFAFYGAIGSGSSMLALRLDTFMISMIMGDLHDTGRFGIASLIGSNIAVPLTAIAAISAPIIAKAWNDNNLEEIQKLYQKSSENLLWVGLFLFGLVILCIHDLFALMPARNHDHIAEIIVVYIVGLKSVIDMATGSNDIIIAYSKKYNFNLLAIVLMSILNIFGNILLIPRLGIIGAALSTFISSLCFNLIKFYFIQINFKMMPYTINTVKIIGINLLMILMCLLIPTLGNPYLNIAFKSTLFGGLVVAFSLYFDVSEDITFVKQQIIAKIRGYVN